MLTRRHFLLTAAATPIAGYGASQAIAGELPADGSAGKPAILSYNGAAIGGYDPVGYFMSAGEVRGDTAHAVEWNEATFLFASAANKKTFEADPEAFAPKYGGYCSYAAALNYTAPTSANAWSIHEDRLYLNFNQHVRSVWEQDKAGYIAKADANWPNPLFA
ncbi:MAG: YHS domain-containing (seleno)protein [Pseudomonadota bacterium]